MTTFLQVKNNAGSVLASSISISDTSLTVATGDGAKFPTPGNGFHISIDDEILKCTARSGDTLTVSRAQEGTTAAAHSAGAAVELRITAQIISELQNTFNNILDDTYGGADGETTKAPTSNAFYDFAHNSGSSFPTSPITGQLFLHSVTGRNILYEYNGSTWIPLYSIGAMTLYVDGTSGTDDLNHGTGTGSNAFKTIQYAIDVIPPIYTGDVIINIGAGNYTEAIIIRGKQPSGNFSITLNGTLSSVADLTSDGDGVQGSGANLAAFYKSGMTANQYQNKILKFTSGSNNDTYKIIDSNSNDAGTKLIYCAGLALAAKPVANDTATVYDWGTTVQNIYCYGVRVNLNYIKCTTANGIQSSDYAVVGATVCQSTVTANYAANCTNYSTLTLTNCLFTTSGSRLIHCDNNSLLDMYGGKCFGVTASTLMIIAEYMGIIRIWYGCIVDTCAYGLYCIVQGLMRTYGVGNVYNVIKNCSTYGVRAQWGSFVLDTAENQYSGNGANESADAATFAYID